MALARLHEENDSVLNEQPKAIHTHCYGHSLNLACSDTIRQSKIIKNAFNTANKIVNLVKKIPSSRSFVGSPERRAVITFTWYIRSLCPTRWTMNAECLDRILSNYKVLYVLWEESLDYVKETDMRSRIIGVQTCMRSFVGAMLGELLLRHTDNLSKTLQSPGISAADGQVVQQ